MNLGRFIHAATVAVVPKDTVMSSRAAIGIEYGTAEICSIVAESAVDEGRIAVAIIYHGPTYHGPTDRVGHIAAEHAVVNRRVAAVVIV